MCGPPRLRSVLVVYNATGSWDEALGTVLRQAHSDRWAHVGISSTHQIAPGSWMFVITSVGSDAPSSEALE